MPFLPHSQAGRAKITYQDGSKFKATSRGHTILSDQPLEDVLKVSPHVANVEIPLNPP